MPRPSGRRNPDYDVKRDRLAYELADFVLNGPSVRASLRQLAHGCGVTEPTLRHYFGDREDVAIAILTELGRRAAPIIAAVGASAPSAEAAVDAYVELSILGVRNGVFARAHSFGIIEGVADDRVGRAYLEHLLEPSLVAVERRLSPHIAPDIGDAGRRAAALMLFAPLLVGVIHEQLLGGDKGAAPLDEMFRALAVFVKGGLGASAR
jgi:AcrR family transcriptional regulator